MNKKLNFDNLITEVNSLSDEQLQELCEGLTSFDDENNHYDDINTDERVYNLKDRILDDVITKINEYILDEHKAVDSEELTEILESVVHENYSRDIPVLTYKNKEFLVDELIDKIASDYDYIYAEKDGEIYIYTRDMNFHWDNELHNFINDSYHKMPDEFKDLENNIGE